MEKRWSATISYQYSDGVVVHDTHHIDEIEELQDIVERGDSFDAILSITIHYQLGNGTTCLKARNA